MKGQRPNEIDHGLCLPFKCSSCSHTGLNLKETSASITSPFIKLAQILTGKKSHILYFQCNNCGLANDIPEEEEETVIQLHRQSQAFQNGELAEEEFMSALMESPSSLVVELYGRAHNWVCSSCNNEVPATFEICWNCGEECSDPEKLIAAKGELKINTSSVFGSSFSMDDKK